MKSRRQNMIVCVRNSGYEASLELRKLYNAIPDADADALGMLRVVDESGEDYLYPAPCFMEVELPTAVRRALQKAA